MYTAFALIYLCTRIAFMISLCSYAIEKGCYIKNEECDFLIIII